MFSQTAAAITVLSGLFTFVIGQQPEYAQCGGIGWTGSTVCASPYVCTYENDYYYQCLPGTGGTTTTTKTTTTSASTKTTTTTSKTTTTASHTTTASSAQCTVNSVSSASSLSSCSSVVIQGFTVPAGSTVTIAAASGASITMAGNVVFAQTTTSGPLFTLNTNNVNFNGNGYHFDGQGALYWDGEGTGGGVTKPHPLIKLKGYGTFADFTVLNSPAHAISVGTSSTTTIQSVTVDDSAGASQGANTDGFDIGASDLTLLNNVVKNQDDCVAINSGSNILIQGMSCDGGHGLSIGSIDSGDTVSNVRFISNTITNSQNGLRIKVDASADSTAKVSGVTYTSNKVSGISKYGVLITQSYPDSYSTPGTSSTISGISFTGGTTTVSVTSAAYGLAIDCGHCTGTWDLSGLDVTAVGKGHELTLGGGVTLSGGTY